MAYKCVPQVRLPKWVVGGRCSGGVEGVVWMVSGQVGLAGPEFRETLHKAFEQLFTILYPRHYKMYLIKRKKRKQLDHCSMLR